MKAFAEKKYKRAILIGAGSFFGLPFSIGEVCYDKILKEYNQEYSRNIVEQVLSDSFIVGGGKGIFGGLFG